MAPQAKSSGRVTNLMQNIIDGEYSLVKIPTITVQDSELSQDILSIFDHPHPLGISPGYSSQGRLVSLAVADDKNCRIIEFAQPRRDFRKGTISKPISQGSMDGRALLQDMILCRALGDIYAFDMGRLCMSLHSDTKLHVTNGIDIQSGFSAVDRKPLTAIQETVGDTVKIMTDNIIDVFRNPVYDPEDRNRATDLAMRAWVSQFIAGYDNASETFANVKKIDTKKYDQMVLDIIAKISTDHVRLDQLKPLQRTHQFSAASDRNGTHLNSSAYNSKFRGGQNLRMTVETNDGRSNYVQRGVIAAVRGKSGLLDATQSLDGKTVTTVLSIGRDDPTTAEARRDATILRILQGEEQLLNDSPWIQNIWFPSPDDSFKFSWPEEWSQHCPIPPKGSPTAYRNLSRLNASQQKAVNTMLSPLNEHRLVLVQGPPGTGKTSVIAAFVQLAIQSGQTGIWLVAQSNVAVKNIGEKLLAEGFHNWRLLVSKDFYDDWNEHLYTNLIDFVIRSSKMWTSGSQLQGCQVILCTLSMLSTPKIFAIKNMPPLNTLIVDEASQIEMGQYISVFANTKTTLRKACFIGDDKQLPPYGQEDLQDLQSIFEIPHLRQAYALFLDTQYRMPPQIGDVISNFVYEGKLKSNSLHPITNKVIACHLVDAPGKEKRLGESYMNSVELEVIMKLAQHFQDEGKNYRIITPYEGQRSSIEQEMKNTPDLDWGDKCFNVDSFQGNEEDYIIISLVRSRELGFLTNLRRTNVMLTRCKKGMFIVSSKIFLAGAGAESLVGQLAEHVGEKAWLSMQDVEEGNF